MSRPQADDLLQSFRFRVVAVEAGFIDATAGFNQVTTPNITVEVGEYREGNRKYTKKQPGVPTVEAMTMQRGIALMETQFADWLLEKLLGGQPYRTDILVNVYNQQNTGEVDSDPIARQIRGAECFPTSVKLIGDLDATSSDINLQEIEAACEEVHLQLPA
jgi:phage tail-like protein